MNVKTRFSIGQEVVLFNGVAMRMEHDEVFAIVIQPNPVEGKTMDPNKKVSENIKEGNIEEGYLYQLQRHQGLLDEQILFESEEECKAYFLQFFGK